MPETKLVVDVYDVRASSKWLPHMAGRACSMPWRTIAHRIAFCLHSSFHTQTGSDTIIVPSRCSRNMDVKDKVEADRHNGGLDPAGRAQLSHRVLKMKVHRILADLQYPPDFP